MAQVSALLALLAALTACNGKGIQDAPQDINVSPRSQEAYDPVYRELENDPVDGKKQQQ
jgi:hypothetical protein